MIRNQKPWSVYLIRCGDQSLYTGISNDVSARFAVHQTGKPTAAKYLRGREPLTLVYTVVMGSRSEASRAEYLIKKLPKRKKEQLIAGQLSLKEIGCSTPDRIMGTQGD